MDTKAKLRALRQAMREHFIDAYIVFSTDPHQSEYLAPHWQHRAWLSGFDGSAGTLIVTADYAGLWTDSRYFIQAERQLRGSGIELQKLKVPHTPEYEGWLREHLAPGSTVGFDGSVVSHRTAQRLERALGARQIDLESGFDLVGDSWPDRPPRPAEPVYELPVAFAGESREDKLARIRAFLAAEELDYYLLIALDDIAWTLNLRGSDVDYNPVALSYLLVGREKTFWFGASAQLTATAAAGLRAAEVTVHDYDALVSTLENLPAGRRIGVDPAQVCVDLRAVCDDWHEVVHTASPVRDWKGRKNATEIDHWRAAMRRDGVALLRLYRWLRTELEQGPVSEVAVAEQLARFRGEQEHYQGESFAAIVGYAGNGAIVHYRATPEHCALIRPEGILLLDSGGQYLDGTTDITRTFALGEPTAEQRRHFTLVLQGHIDLALARFPAGTSGAQLDILARNPLWRAGLNYGHGTGHGVGFFLNVHEGPQSISPNPRSAGAQRAFESGMVTSNEPGYYREGEYGIRIENLVLCVEDPEQKDWLRFENLTLFPIDRTLIDPALLTPPQLAYLDDYHAWVQEELSPLLEPAERAWLAAACAPLGGD
jgi:Xaa-Pro aminopeptidase